MTKTGRFIAIIRKMDHADLVALRDHAAKHAADKAAKLIMEACASELAMRDVCNKFSREHY